MSMRLLMWILFALAAPLAWGREHARSAALKICFAEHERLPSIGRAPSYCQSQFIFRPKNVRFQPSASQTEVRIYLEKQDRASWQRAYRAALSHEAVLALSGVAVLNVTVTSADTDYLELTLSNDDPALNKLRAISN